MGWPYDKYLWRGDALPAKKQYAAVAKAISQFEPVTMLTDPSVVEEARQYLADAPNVTVQAMPINDGEPACRACLYTQCCLLLLTAAAILWTWRSLQHSTCLDLCLACCSCSLLLPGCVCFCLLQ